MRIFSESDFVPRFLDAEEEIDPQQVIRQLFQTEPLPYLRETVWEFFKTMVTGNYSHSLDRRERQKLVLCYENLQRLIEAVHLLYRNEMTEQKKFDPNEIFKKVFESINLESQKGNEDSGGNPELPT